MTPQEFVVIHRTDPPNRRWEGLERSMNILSLVAIPIVIAVFGWLIQDAVSKRSVSQEYVKLAVTILTDRGDNTNSTLREWAVDLLSENSPTRFSAEVANKLKTGEATLPPLGGYLNTLSTGGSLAVSPDGQWLAAGNSNGAVLISRMPSGSVVASIQAHEAEVSGIAFSADSRFLYTGSVEGEVRIWELSTREILSTYAIGAEIVGLAVTPDDKMVLLRTRGGAIYILNLGDGKLTRIGGTFLK